MWTVAILLLLGPAAFILLGVGLLWFQSWGRQYGLPTRRFYRSRVATRLIWLMLVLGVVAMSIIIEFHVAPTLWGVMGAILILATWQHWRGEVRFLVWTLSVAAERGMPLEAAARAFARDHHGAIAARASRLADYLAAAMPLSLALSRSGLVRYFPEVRLAAAVGEKTGTLGPTLRKTVEQSTDSDRVLGSILGRYAYLSCIVAVLVLMLVFFMIKIIPTFETMFQEFGLKLPRLTIMVIDMTVVAVRYWYLVPYTMAVFIVAVGVPLAYYLARALRTVPVLGQWFSPVNEIAVLQLLAVAVAQRQPVVESLGFLATYSQGLKGRARLVRAVEAIAGGVHWCDALRRAGLVTRAHAAVFKSAERAGNLAWALDAMAQRLLYRTVLRTRAIVHVGYPVLLGLVGAIVFYIAAGLLLPLFALVRSLSQV